MRVLQSLCAVAALAIAGPLWAHGGHGHRHHGHHHHGYHAYQGHPPAWGHYRHRRGPPPRHYTRYERHYYSAPRTYTYSYSYAAPAPAPGIHIVTPNIYIPLR